MSENTTPQQFRVQRIYLKDVSFETPKGFKTFAEKWDPQVHVDVNNKINPVEENTNEVVLSLTMTAKLQDEVALLIEIQQAGIFTTTGFDKSVETQILTTKAPEILFPYVRELLDSLAVRGGFPPIMLQPMNFEALYKQAVEQQNQQDQEAKH